MSTSARRRISAVMVAAGLLGGAFAQPTAASAATTCYGGAVNWTYNGGTKDIGPYRASPRCRDINLKTNGGQVVACVVFIDHTNNCNTHPEPDIFGATWAEVATDVIDGTRFVVRVFEYGGNTSESGKLAF
ncbi:hypothetical protein [Micromonospora sp. NPDC049679]|uniref:hypothetical protein n=1 Tax=Micromonospora sp. NPDC049679 TaxID=3155920 RepID=UPI0033DACC41